MRVARIVAFSVVGFSCLIASAVDPIKPIDDMTTHKQVGILKIADSDNPLPINAFCLNADGLVVAACGSGPGEIRIVNGQGEITQSWSVEVKPEAINVAADGTILVGGEGKLLRFSATGQLLQAADSPHATKLRSSTAVLREEAIKALTRRAPSPADRIASYESMLKRLSERAKTSELSESEKQVIKMLPQMIQRYEAQAAEETKANEADGGAEPSAAGPSETAIAQQIENLIKSKVRISSISSDSQHVFVATRGVAGYGYDVWRLNDQFADGEVIVSELRGCCGQMDVQCCPNGLFVAENSRHRVVRFSTSGKEIINWGQRDRGGEDGFTGCCNPMNVTLHSSGDVYTAESGSGRIKRFDASGKLLAYVGDVELVPGCKNVSIAVSPDASKVYMLDLTRNHIVMMQQRAGSEGASVRTVSVGETEND